MLHRASLLVVLVLLPSAARAQPAAAALPTFDVAAATGWFAADRSVREGCCSSWSSSLFKGVSAGQIPIGATVKLQTHDGRRMRAVLMAVDEAGILVKPATRVPEPSRRLPFDSLQALERFEDRVSFPKYIATGAAIAGSVFLMLLASAR